MDKKMTKNKGACILLCLILLAVFSVSAFSQENPLGQANKQEVTIPINIALVPALSINGKNSDLTTNYFSLSVLMARSNKLYGAGFGGIQQTKSKMMGIQMGLVSIASGTSVGLQNSIVNYQEGEMTGAQYGLVNISKNLKGVSLGLVNLMEGDNTCPIGLINNFKDGHGNFETWYEGRTKFLNFAFRNEGKLFYYIWTVGGTVPFAFETDDDGSFSILMGPGRTYNVSKSVFFTTDALFGWQLSTDYINFTAYKDSNSINRDTTIYNCRDNVRGLILKFRVGMNFKIAEHLALEVGLIYGQLFSVATPEKAARENGGLDDLDLKREGKLISAKSNIFPNLGNNGNASWFDYFIGLKF